MIPNPILKVLSTLSCHMVRHLLIGGQACVLYGAAEFSRDCDLVQRFPDSVAAVEFERPWLKSLDITNLGQIEQSLRAEEDAQRQADREYWQPLKEELEQLRMNRPRRT